MPVIRNIGASVTVEDASWGSQSRTYDGYVVPAAGMAGNVSAGVTIECRSDAG